MAPTNNILAPYHVDTTGAAGSGYQPPRFPEPAPSARDRRNGRPPAELTNWVIPHEDTFGAIYNLYSKTYLSRFDEALRASYVDALAMRRDGYIDGLIRHRKMPVIALPYQIECEDPGDPEQVKVARQMSKLIEAIPSFRGLIYWLQEALFYGKSGAQLLFGPKQIDGRKRMTVKRHIPINGDKIIWRWGGDGAGILVLPSWTPPGGKEKLDHISYADRGTVYFLDDPADRKQFLIHRFEPSDTDYLFESDLAGSVGGLGLRSRLYHAWWLRTEVTAWALNGLQRIGINGQFYAFYSEGDDASKQAIEKSLKNLVDQNIAAFPRREGVASSTIERIEPAAVAYDVIKQFIDYFDRITRDCILGQPSTVGPSSSGAGANDGDRNDAIPDSIVKADADSLAETFTEQLLPTLIELNDWEYRGKFVRELPFNLRFKFQTDSYNVLKKAQTALILRQLNVDLDATDLRDQAGFKAPKETATALAGHPGGVPGPGGSQAAHGALGGLPAPGAAPKGSAPGPALRGGAASLPPTQVNAAAKAPQLARERDERAASPEYSIVRDGERFVVRYDEEFEALHPRDELGRFIEKDEAVAPASGDLDASMSSSFGNGGSESGYDEFGAANEFDGRADGGRDQTNADAFDNQTFEPNEAAFNNNERGAEHSVRDDVEAGDATDPDKRVGRDEENFDMNLFWENVDKLGPGVRAWWQGQMNGEVIRRSDSWYPWNSSFFNKRVIGYPGGKSTWTGETKNPRIYLWDGYDEIEAAKEFVKEATESWWFAAKWKGQVFAIPDLNNGKDLEAWREWYRKEAFSRAAMIAEGYLQGLTIVNQGADWAVTLGELAEGEVNVLSNLDKIIPGLRTLLPLAKKGVVRIYNKAGKLLKTIPTEELTSLEKLRRKSKGAERPRLGSATHNKTPKPANTAPPVGPSPTPPVKRIRAWKSTQTGDTSKNSAILRKNLGLKSGDGFDAHHIVESTGARADTARKLLDRYQIDINAAANGVPLKPSGPRPAHRGQGIHSHRGIDAVNRRLEKAIDGVKDWAEGRQNLLNTLSQIRDEILDGTFP
jgi:hypothetical protein